MPRLLALLPCERAIISKDDDSVSLITVTQGIAVHLPDDSIVGQNVLLPHQWAIFAFWLKEPGDDGVELEQRIELIAPDDARLLVQDVRFTIVRNTHSQIGRLEALPVPKARIGDLPFTVRVSIKRADAQVFAVAGEFPLTVTLAVSTSQPVFP